MYTVTSKHVLRCVTKFPAYRSALYMYIAYRFAKFYNDKIDKTRDELPDEL